MGQGLRICRKCGVVFDLKFRQDCPLCHSGEYMQMEKAIS